MAPTKNRSIYGGVISLKNGKITKIPVKWTGINLYPKNRLGEVSLRILNSIILNWFLRIGRYY